METKKIMLAVEFVCEVPKDQDLANLTLNIDLDNVEVIDPEANRGWGKKVGRCLSFETIAESEMDSGEEE